MQDSTKRELVRLTKLLASAIDLSGFRYRAVEQSLGWSEARLSQLMTGKIELKVRHVLQICEVIGCPPARLFHAAYPTADQGGPEAERMQRLLACLQHWDDEDQPAAPAPPPPAEVPRSSAAEAERSLLSALAQYFRGLA